jgi:hypothetical protein
MRTIRFDLELIMVERAGALGGRLMYRNARVSPSTVERIVHGYLAALNDLLDDPHRTLEELARRLDAAEAAREHNARRLLQQRAFAALTQAVRPIS